RGNGRRLSFGHVKNTQRGARQSGRAPQERAREHTAKHIREAKGCRSDRAERHALEPLHPSGALPAGWKRAASQGNRRRISMKNKTGDSGEAMFPESPIFLVAGTGFEPVTFRL